MPIREVVVRSLGEFVDQITPREPDPVTGRRRETGVFHGAADASWPLLTSLARLGGVNPPHTKVDLEAHILRNFIRYSRPYLKSPPANDWELLVLAQHHGVPTRLLDWSYSPLVAAHFATRRPRAGVACAIWRLDWQTVHRHFGFPELALLIDDVETLFDRPDAEGGEVHGRRHARFTPWVCFGERRRTGPEDRPFACMIEPSSLDERIVVQRGTFTLASDTSRSFDDFLSSQGLGATLTKFVVPAERAALLRDQLDLVGMDERRLFPDLDGVAAELRRYYS
ncbi:MAG TPA: FRG domain-containing protein [Gemmatimonadales bacterium]|nr:FRG domain-containing protein [Gemmatimonadales bacterium]